MIVQPSGRQPRLLRSRRQTQEQPRHQCFAERKCEGNSDVVSSIKVMTQNEMTAATAIVVTCPFWALLEEGLHVASACGRASSDGRLLQPFPALF